MTQPPGPYASADELATYMQTEFEADETATANMLLGFIATLIRTEYKGIDERTPPIDPALPKLVSLELVSRKMFANRNGGATEVTEAMDEVTVTSKYGGGAKPFGGLELDSWAINLLAPEPTTTGPRAFGIKMASGARAPAEQCNTYPYPTRYPYGGGTW